MLRLRLKEIAEEKGYNMSSFSRASDISFKTIKRLWQHPETDVTKSTLENIMIALNIEDISELLEWVSPNKDQNEGTQPI
jgi:DNA-binding Xre family transcriptional regulator